MPKRLVEPFLLLMRLIIALVALTLILVLALPIGFYGMAMYLEPSLPNISDLKKMPLQMPLQIYTRDNKLIGQYGNTYSLPITYNEMPKPLIQAFLAAEDDSFFEHSGISVKGLGRAITQMVGKNDNQTGGSTITQQVAKNYFLTPEQTFERKLTEMYLARKIENNLNKTDILTLYVNKIYLGQGAYGVKAGARRYYNKTLEELTLAQMAMLAGLPKAPSEFNPVANPKRALERRDWILARMKEKGYISQSEYNTALTEPINLNIYQEHIDLDLPYIAELARASLVNQYGNAVMNSGWRVQLTVDSADQLNAEQSLKNGLWAYDRRHGQRSGVVAKKGDVRTMLPYDGYYPAQITKISKKGVEAILHTGEPIKILGGRWLKVGNIVRIKPKGEGEKRTWTIAQVPAVEGALASVNPENGAVIALAGGFSFYKTKFNRAVQGYRQPGSTIKPLIYSAALESGKFTPDSILIDAPLKIGSWQPKNAGGGFGGAMPLKRALAVSRNIPVIRTYLAVGKKYVHSMLGSFSLEKQRLPDGPVLALGATEATPLQMATAYSTFANGGHRIQPYLIERIYNFDNDLIYQAHPQLACARCFNKDLAKYNAELEAQFIENKQKTNLLSLNVGAGNSDSQDNKKDSEKDSSQGTPPVLRLNPKRPVQYGEAEQAPRIMSAKNAFDMAQMLRGVVTGGTAKRAQAIGRPDIGGKTGTTNAAKDAWFAGIHPTNAAVVWVGFDDPKSLGASEYGGVAALPIWVDFMKGFLSGKPVQWVEAGNLAKSKKEKQQVINITDDTPIDAINNANKPSSDSAAAKSAALADPVVDLAETQEFADENGDIPEGDGGSLSN